MLSNCYAKKRYTKIHVLTCEACCRNMLLPSQGGILNTVLYLKTPDVGSLLFRL